MAQTPNKQQLEAINALGKSIIVSASAGAGKTTVLINRLMKRILNDKVSIDRICALTFTDAAASEMKKRLLKALAEQNEETPSDYLSQQMMMVQTAHISTIHSFCLSIIKDHGYLLGIQDEMTQNILDPGMVALIQKQALHDVLDIWAKERSDDLKSLLHHFTVRIQNLNPFFETVLELLKFLKAKHDQQAAIDAILSCYCAQSFDDLPTHIQTAFFQHHQHHLTLIMEHLKAVIEVVPQTEKYQELANTLLHHFDLLRSLKQRIEALDPSFIDDVDKALDIKLTTIQKQEDYKLAGDEFASIVQDYIKHIEPLKDSLFTLNQQAPLVEKLLAFTLDVQTRFQAIKEEEGGLDFDDFEHLAYQLLTHNNHTLAKQLREQFDEIMVDEFQDTNDFQDAILSLISNGKNIFRVGDVKQSIYRFRGAKPSIMQSLMTEQQIKNIFLSFNYRSKDAIVFFNNDLFGALLNMTQGMTYSQYDKVDTGLESQSQNSQPVEFLIVNDSEEHEPDFEKLPWDDSASMRKARVVAQEVIRHHKMGYAFKDIVVLIKSHATKVFLKRAFEEVNIPHFIDDRGGFYQSSVVSALLSFFHFMLDESDYSLVKVLQSPFIGYSYDDLANLKLAGKPTLLKALTTNDPATHQLITALIKKWQRQDVVSSILDIINLNDAYHKRLSIQDKTNLDALLEKAVRYQTTGTPTIPGFIDFVANLDDDKSAEAIPLSNEDDVVTAMTIHQSKGLQFPVVLFWSFGRRTNFDLKSNIITDDHLGLALSDKVEPYNVLRKSLLHPLMKTRLEAEDLEETLRLVYVALTRPQERLVIIDCKTNMDPIPMSHSLLYSYSRLIDLLILPPSIHKRITVLDYADIPNLMLDPLPKINESKTFKEPRFTTTTKEEISHGKFVFNPQFLEATAYGTKLHEAVENLPQRSWNKDDLASIESRFHKPLITYNNHPFTQMLYQAEAMDQEVPFLLSLDGIMQNGIIDATYTFSDKVIIVDYKTDNATVEELIERYTNQLRVYETALKASTDKAIECYLYSFHNNDYIKV